MPVLKDVLYRSGHQRLDVARVEEHYKVPDGETRGWGEGVSAAVLLAGCEVGSGTMEDVNENRQHHAHIYAPFAATPVSACVRSTSPSDLGCGSVTQTSIFPPGSSQGAGMAGLGLTSSL
jgi:hypothetical protein